MKKIYLHQENDDKNNFYKRFTRQLSNLLFLANPIEHSWQCSPSNPVSFFRLSDIQTIPPIAFVHDDDTVWGTLVNCEPQTLWPAIRHSLNLSQCYKYHYARGNEIEREKPEKLYIFCFVHIIGSGEVFSLVYCVMST